MQLAIGGREMRIETLSRTRRMRTLPQSSSGNNTAVKVKVRTTALQRYVVLSLTSSDGLALSSVPLDGAKGCFFFKPSLPKEN